VSALVVDISSMPGATLARLVGEIDIATAPELREHLTTLPDHNTIAEMGEVSLLSAAGLPLLLDLHDRLARAGALLVLVNAPSPVRRVLTVTGLDTRFVMASTVEDAVELIEALLRTVSAAETCRATQSGDRSHR
jgi:anti-sigma B factor antagonist